LQQALEVARLPGEHDAVHVEAPQLAALWAHQPQLEVRQEGVVEVRGEVGPQAAAAGRQREAAAEAAVAAAHAAAVRAGAGAGAARAAAAAAAAAVRALLPRLWR
jgi:hypothetical protein